MKETYSIKTKNDISSFFSKSPNKIFAFRELSAILDTYKKIWQLPKNITTFEFVEFLSKNKILKYVTIDFPYRKTSRYISSNKLSFFEILLGMNKNSYFTHTTALFFHNLIPSLPRIIYLNVEQKEHKTYSQTLEQSKIDFAFSNSQRISKNTAKFQQHNICLLNGKFTNKLGVIKIKKAKIGTIDVTDIERTLIDLAVRPIYGGGVKNVLNAYKKAKNKLSIEKLVDTLIKLDYIYPYHQAIGFYLELSNVCKKSYLDLFKNLGLKYNFYLTHNMTKTNYSKEWQLYYPAELDL